MASVYERVQNLIVDQLGVEENEEVGDVEREGFRRHEAAVVQT